MSVMFTNNAVSTLSGAITSTQTTIPLQTGAGALWPDLAAGGSGAWCPTTLVDSSKNIEIVKVTSISGDVLTVVRGQEGTTARAYASGSYVGLRLTEAAILEIQTNITNLQTLSATLAPLASPALTGTPTAPDLTGGTSSQIATENDLTASVWSTGDAKITLKTTADPGWLLMADQTIGPTGSSASYANNNCQALYELIWNIISQTYAPVSGGRGASASADWGAAKPMQLLYVLGRALAVSGGGSGLTDRGLGSITGEENHTLSTGEMPSHNHGVNDPEHSHQTGDGQNFMTIAPGDYGWALPGNGNVANAQPSTVSGTGNATTGVSIQNTGGGGAHNNMQPTTFWNVMIKL